MLYDSRASAYEKKNRLRDALRDAKKTIDIAPQQWHGYFRSARLFAALGQTDAALRMCSLALERLGDASKHEARRRELVDLRQHLEAQTRCPVSGMPVELLLTIFRLSNKPVVISHVCRRWREVALSQSTLWHSLELAAPAKKALLRAQEWHRRSCGRIVKLNIHRLLGANVFAFESDDMHPDDRARFTEILATIRLLDWTKLKESHMEEVDVESFFYALSHSTGFVHQHLETLTASYDYPSGVVFGRLEYNELPWESLRTFNITNGRCNWVQLSTSMRHLTSFEYKDGGNIGIPAEFHRFLQANPGLEKLVVELPQWHPEVEVTESLTLAHLRHVEFSGIVPFIVKSGNFSLPLLQIMRMTKLKYATSMLSELFKDEGTSFAELVELTARFCTLGPQVLTSVLLRAPKLETLTCTGNLINAVAESLTTRPASEDPDAIDLPILCPALGVLNFSQSPNLKTGPVMRIVKERIALATSQDSRRYQLPGHDGYREVSCIRALRVDECPHIEAELLPWFRKNVPQFSCRYELRRKR